MRTLTGIQLQNSVMGKTPQNFFLSKRRKTRINKLFVVVGIPLACDKFSLFKVWVGQNATGSSAEGDIECMVAENMDDL